MNEILEMKDKILEYWDYRSSDYHTEYAKCMDEEMEIWKSVFSEILLTDKKIRAVEVGTGTGLLAISLATMGHDVTGVDLSENMLEKAAENAKEKGVDVSLVQGDAEEIPLNDGEYDFVLSKYLLWTLPQPDKFMSECCRLLKDGGLMMIVDGLWFQNPDGTEKKSSRYEKFNELYSGVKPNLPLAKNNTPERITALAQSHGFEAVSWRFLKDYDAFLERNDPSGHEAGYIQPPHMVLAKKRSQT
ncbi:MULTISPECIES: class I SAM-dependent methyltransferase [Methanosarcina]|uniref:Bifunctional 3-demethylubiquinone-9 3-methyltransferase/ 2-octaprenyl-6-hydroxy phenol methylase n=3 Tax=Methanosarcina barkeri TaxID=2208 RepID=A0A0E3QSN6_METBA|nr:MULTISPECIES: class I SAM-dependent methyltransferase [Methanosarcina]AKB53897.1 bifunctional 3-demethylubiquinone-9 3-methyltransferase/ 2-octaprenyl-6-hydroxy phenol methylase [Methanosarcina barkeri MS]AKB58011.1 bifunctional 3-demethylubiquinone-9 3-methyltransferase/ 2-octaprenyl-6-hydroxy phenol methylase [Methanosarcina barkeri 227]AKJ39727.1 SAM-dependent methyltransferase [Methanosarcina barkeri CM1]OED10386.1 methyltransferase type 11 [Methanosarcina sp. A14]